MFLTMGIRFGSKLAMAILVAVQTVRALDPTRLLYQYPNEVDRYPRRGTWIENVAQRENGNLLFTIISPSGPHGLVQLGLNNRPAVPLIARPEDLGYRNSSVGIVETTPELFYFVATNLSWAPPFGQVRGTDSVYSVNFKDRKKKVQLLAELPTAEFLNGMTKFNDTYLLVVDSKRGLIYGLSTETGPYSIVVQDSLMAREPSAGVYLGINGAHSSPTDNSLYFTNSQQKLFAKQVLHADAKPVGNSTVVSTLLPEGGLELTPDDFALDRNDKYEFVTTQYGNSIQRIVLDGTSIMLIAGGLNDAAIAEPTSAVAGRRAQDCNTLYVVTGGGFVYPVETAKGPVSFGAQIVAVELGFDQACDC